MRLLAIICAFVVTCAQIQALPLSKQPEITPRGFKRIRPKYKASKPKPGSLELVPIAKESANFHFDDQPGSLPASTFTEEPGAPGAEGIAEDTSEDLFRAADKLSESIHTQIAAVDKFLLDISQGRIIVSDAVEKAAQEYHKRLDHAFHWVQSNWEQEGLARDINEFLNMDAIKLISSRDPAVQAAYRLFFIKTGTSDSIPAVTMPYNIALPGKQNINTAETAPLFETLPEDVKITYAPVEKSVADDVSKILEEAQKQEAAIAEQAASALRSQLWENVIAYE